MSEHDAQETPRDAFLGEIETEIVGMQYHEARVMPGERINVERESKNAHCRRALRVENGHFEPVGYLPKKLASWLAPLIDSGQICLDGYVPAASVGSREESPHSCPVRLMVFQSQKGRCFLERREPRSELETLHQTVLQAYQNAQAFQRPELILGLANGLRPLEKQELLPETRLLLALLPRMAHELCISQGMRTMGRFRELLATLVVGPPTHRHNLTFFPLCWPEVRESAYHLLGAAIEAGEAVVEEINELGSVPNLAVTNKSKRPLLIPEGEILMGAKQNRVINVTVLVAAGAKFTLPVSCVEAGRWRYQSRYFESKFCAPPSLRNKKLRAVHRNRAAGGPAASDQDEVWDEVQSCLDGVAAQSETASLTDAFAVAGERLKETEHRPALPEGAAGVLVGHHHRIIGVDLFDSPATLKSLWNRLSDAYCFDALRSPDVAPPTPAGHAHRFLERLAGAAKPRLPALALGEELEISGEGFVGAALLYDGALCHLAAFSDTE